MLGSTIPESMIPIANIPVRLPSPSSRENRRCGFTLTFANGSERRMQLEETVVLPGKLVWANCKKFAFSRVENVVAFQLQ